MVTVVFVQVVLCNEPAEMFDYISEDQISTDVGGQLEFDANEWTQHKSVRISTLQLVIKEHSSNSTFLIQFFNF